MNHDVALDQDTPTCFVPVSLLNGLLGFPVLVLATLTVSLGHVASFFGMSAMDDLGLGPFCQATWI